jgi:gamma-glutamyl hercynylcysteine S-oxide synthase
VPDLAADLLDARAQTLALAASLDRGQLLGPQLPIVNPPLWELGHVGWFQERWVLRTAGLPPVRPGSDALYDSSAIPHDTRWSLPLPGLDETLADLAEIGVRVRILLERGEADPYFARLATFHEDMHHEAMAFSRQTLGWRAAWDGVRGPRDVPYPAPDVELPGGTFFLGARRPAGEPPLRDAPFVFDNEKWAHPVALRPFRIASAPVIQAAFAAFVDAGGYERRELWTDAGWAWRSAAGARHPVYWARADGGWRRREHEAWVPLEPRRPVSNVCAFEAEAFCMWAGRRLPTEAEWETAAAAGRCARAGEVWEWTASDFLPYPGFAPDPYRDYSAPWFGTHRVLRGGSFATPARLLHTTFRNFYTPDRRDPWAGFRTCAP